VIISGLEAGVHTLQIADHDLLVTATAVAHQVQIPALAPGEYPVRVDGAATDAAFDVYAAQLRVELIDVGQGDATLIVAPDGYSVLIDAGAEGHEAAIRERLAAYGIETLDLVVMTHHDADHIGGFPALIVGADGIAGSADDLRVNAWWHDGALEDCATQTCAALRQLARPRLVPQLSTSIVRPGGFSLRVVAIAGSTEAAPASPAALTDPNARSLVLLISLNGHRGLVLGDLTGGGLGSADIETPLAASLGGAVAWVRVGHHGSRTSSNRNLVAATAPRLVLISAGSDNAYCHPAQEIIDRWAAVAQVLVTGTGQSGSPGCAASVWPDGVRPSCGTISLSSADGVRATARCSGQTIDF
jgi:competence protein ComEC